MILYFSGTGNSKFAAEFLADHLKDQCISMNYILKHKEDPSFISEKPFVVCAPIYAGRFPSIIMKLIRRAQLAGSKRIYYLATLASKSCSCEQSLRKLTSEKHMEMGGLFFLSMPNNYVLGGNIPSKDDAEYQIKYVAVPELYRIAETIEMNDVLPEGDTNSVTTAISSSVNSLYSKFMVSSDNYVVNDDCVVCGKCEKHCPVNNIIIINGDPVFRKRCIGCYGCINICPKKAINIGKKTEKTNRYFCPDYKDWKAKGLT
ncbi:MAG: EFR1 family ferrodoxin [Ruminococcus sp.]|nr:EFR1 family ferrodoxin [Ruminococcus sp.]